MVIMKDFVSDPFPGLWSSHSPLGIALFPQIMRYQLITYNTSLVRGAVGISGGGVKVDGPERQQSLFNDLANFVGCGSLIGMAKIDCLREAPYENIYAHTQTVGYFLGYRSAASPW